MQVTCFESLLEIGTWQISQLHVSWILSTKQRKYHILLWINSDSNCFIMTWLDAQCLLIVRNWSLIWWNCSESNSWSWWPNFWTWRGFTRKYTNYSPAWSRHGWTANEARTHWKNGKPLTSNWLSNVTTVVIFCKVLSWKLSKVFASCIVWTWSCGVELTVITYRFKLYLLLMCWRAVELMHLIFPYWSLMSHLLVIAFNGGALMKQAGNNFHWAAFLWLISPTGTAVWHLSSFSWYWWLPMFGLPAKRKNFCIFRSFYWWLYWTSVSMQKLKVWLLLLFFSTYPNDFKISFCSGLLTQLLNSFYARDGLCAQMQYFQCSQMKGILNARIFLPSWQL